MRIQLKKIFIVIAMFVAACVGYVIIVNSNSVNMTGRQKILKAMYPVLMWVNKLTGKNTSVLTHAAVAPPVSFYSLTTTLLNGTTLDMASFKGKKVLLVNTASACGYTAQLEQLQQLYSQYNPSLVIIGFPANDFKEQEQGSNEEIGSFCKKNYGVTFPLAEKSIVVKKPGQNSVFQWLTEPAMNGWNSQAPTWNFSKYLVNETGMLTHYFAPGVNPAGNEVLAAIR